DIFHQFETDTTKITFGQLQDLVYSQGTQIGNPGNYLAHISNTAGILRSLVIVLDKIHKGQLKLPHPDIAYAIGLVHDLNATFSNYAIGGQQSKEFDEFVLAKKLGFKRMADEAAMHSDYLGAINLLAEGVDFPKQEAYIGMKQILTGDGPLSYPKIEREFNSYLEGKDRLNLLLLTISDYTEKGQPHFNADKFDENFEERSKDIMWRYHGKAHSQGKLPSLLGQALVNGGMKRIAMYKKIVNVLLEANPEKIERLKQETNFF
ncbi:hypothetical protein JW851_04360, partial [Candidatus Woesearchaeota archaeon]|nr:hypothetical protein [Candidatus Woesearchaeota archaeon]